MRTAVLWSPAKVRQFKFRVFLGDKWSRKGCLLSLQLCECPSICRENFRRELHRLASVQIYFAQQKYALNLTHVSNPIIIQRSTWKHTLMTTDRITHTLWLSVLPRSRPSTLPLLPDPPAPVPRAEQMSLSARSVAKPCLKQGLNHTKECHAIALTGNETDTVWHYNRWPRHRAPSNLIILGFFHMILFFSYMVLS